MKRIALNTAEEGICRTLLATYHKVGSFNVFEHNFPAVMEIYEEEDFKPSPRIPEDGRVGGDSADNYHQ